MKRMIASSLIAAGWACCRPAPMNALGAKLGTLGPGLEATVALAEQFNLRLGGTYLPYSFNVDVSDAT